jgi:hypothetical protein
MCSPTREKALSVLAPAGIILWHGLRVALRIRRDRHRWFRRGEPIHWIRGTRFAIGIFPDPVGEHRRLHGLAEVGVWLSARAAFSRAVLIGERESVNRPDSLHRPRKFV